MSTNASPSLLATTSTDGSKKDEPADQPVYLFMDSPLVRLPTNMTVKGARQVMGWKRVEYCLVSEGGRVLGVLSKSDLIDAPASDRAWDWTSRSLAGVNANQGAAETLALMERGRVSHLLVSSGPVLLGIVTEQRLRRALGLRPALVQAPVGPRFTEGSNALH